MFAEDQQVIVKVRLRGESSIAEIREAEEGRISTFPFEPGLRGTILESSIHLHSLLVRKPVERHIHSSGQGQLNV